MTLTARQQRFVDEYLIDLNATQAAIRAGYSEKTARQVGAETLSKPYIAEAIALAQQERQKRTHITADRVLQELARIAFFDIRKLYNEDGTLKKPTDLDDDAAAVLSGVDVVEQIVHEADEQGNLKPTPLFTKKAKVFDKGAALALAMRHLGMLKDKVEMSGKDGAPLVQPVLNVTIGGK